MKLDHQVLLHLLIDMADRFSPLQAPECVLEVQALLAKDKVEVSMTPESLLSFVTRVLQSKDGNFGPLSAFLGGYLGQEVIKAITNKFMPTNQFVYFDCLEVVKDD